MRGIAWNQGRRSVSGGALGLLLLLAACGGTDPTATVVPTVAAIDTVAATAVVAQPTDTTAAPTATLAAVATVAAPTDTVAAPTDTVAAPTVAAPTATVAVAPTATTAPVVVATNVPPTLKPLPPTPKPLPPTVRPTAKPTVAPAAKVVAVVEKDFAFAPATITIDRGTTIEWTNVGPTDHTVADDKVSWSSDILKTGQKYRYTFNTPGTITVICTLHPDMISTVIVK